MAAMPVPAVTWALAVVAIAAPALAQVPSFPPEEELAGRSAGELVAHPGKYGEHDADWGIIFVPENRSEPDSGLIRLPVVRQRARAAATAEPLFTLVGGPGSSNIWGSGDHPPQFFTHNDLVRVGYRGIDGGAKLRCPEFTRALLVERPLSAENIALAREALRDCRDRLAGEGVDIDAYNLLEVVDDIEAVRKALGYEKIDFLAVSWGTQIATTYCQRYPANVHRMLMIGAGGRARGFDLWEPEIIDRKLRRYGELWQADPEAVARTPDIIRTIEKVLRALPGEWRGVRIDPDKVRLSAWYMLKEAKGAAQVLDAFAAAEQGDLGGLAVLSWGYDTELKKELAWEYGSYHGEFFSKVMSTGLDPARDWVAEMDPPGSILGSPAAKLLWGTASRGGWPMRVIAPEYCRNDSTEVEALVLMGNLDFSSPHEYVRDELMPYLKRGRLVVLSEMGHTDVARLQHEAFYHLASRFFAEGAVDTSRFVYKKIDFTPAETLSAYAREVIPE